MNVALSQLIVYTQQYSESFMNCYSCLQELMSNAEHGEKIPVFVANVHGSEYKSIDTDYGLAELRRDFSDFIERLRETLNSMLRPDDVVALNEMFDILKENIPGEFFDNELLTEGVGSIYQRITKLKGVEAQIKSELINGFEELNEFLEWFDRNNKECPLKGIRELLNLRDQQENELYGYVSGHNSTDKEIKVPDGVQKGNPLTRDAIKYLFQMLRHKGVIKNIPDTELSEIIGKLTGFSAQKIRQGILHTKPATNQLIKLLESIIEHTRKEL